MTNLFRMMILLVGVMLSSALQAQLPTGSQAPPLELPDASGKKISLASYRGKWVLVDFWASWCMPCRASNRAVRKFYPQWKQKGLEVFGVSLDEDRADWLKAVKQDRITWVQVNTPAQWDSEMVAKWQFSQIPTTYLIDPKGIIRAVDPDPGNILSMINTASK